MFINALLVYLDIRPVHALTFNFVYSMIHLRILDTRNILIFNSTVVLSILSRIVLIIVFPRYVLV